MIKVLHVINDLNNGGAERLLVNVLPLLKNNLGIDVSVLQLSDRSSVPQYVDMLEKEGVEVHTLTHGNIYRPDIIFLLRNFIRHGSFEVIHVHLFPCMYYVAAATVGLKVPLIFTEHSTHNRRWGNSYLRIPERMIYIRYRRIIAISPAIKEKLLRWTGLQERIVLLRNGVETEKFSSAKPYPREEFLNALEVPQNARLMMMTARFIYPKDHATVMEALKKLPENYHLLFAGGAGDLQKAKDFAEESGIAKRVHFLGFRNDIPQLMKTVDINVLSSFYEGMSGVTCEAMAAGKPFLGSDVPGINDVVPDRRFLFEAQNPHDLAVKIKNIMTNRELCLNMQSEGVAFVRKFDIDTMIGNLNCLYLTLKKNDC